MGVRTTKKRMLEDVEPVYGSVIDGEIMYGVSRWTWRAMAYDGRIESVKVGTRLLIPLSEFRRVIAEGTRKRIDGRAAGEPSAKSRHRDSSVTSARGGDSAHA
jgi:hypothetical protein